WARSCETGHQLEEARAHFREASAAYQAVASQAATPADGARWLWHSSECAIQGQDYPTAIAQLKHFLEVETTPNRLGEAWFVLAQVHHDCNDAQAASAAYHKCIELDGPFAFRARYQLALALMEEGKLDDAEAALKQNLELMRDAPEEEAQEKSLFTLA